MSSNTKDLERSIDRALSGFIDWAIRNVKRLLILFVVLAVFWVLLLPLYETWLPLLGAGAVLLFQLLFAIMFMIVQFVAIFWFLGRPRIYWTKPGETGVGFADYKGNPEVLEAARRVVTLLQGQTEFKKMGGEPIRGLLLIGPPGTGKSYLAQCISTEAGVPFGYLAASSIRGMFWGMDVLQVWNLYRKARKLANKYGGCILFIDEIDAIGASRTSQGPGTGFGGMMFGGGGGALNQLLLEMDPPPQDQNWRQRLLRRLGVRRTRAERPNVLTVGATNIADILDPALLRPGRFDRKISVDHPSADGRREIIEYYLDKVQHEELPLEKMVSDTIGYTPVAIKYVINEGVVLAHFDGRTTLTYRDFTRARETHEWGLRQPIKNMNQEERRRLAFHEAGHAFAQIRLLPRERFSKVTIIRHGQALGLSATKPLEEMYTNSREELLADIQVSLASRAAEEQFLKTQVNGVTSDLHQATRLALACVGIWGMNGTLASQLAYGGGQPDGQAKRSVDKMLKEQYEKVKALISENRHAVAAIAEGLLAKDELDEDEVTVLIAEANARQLAEAACAVEPPASPPDENPVPALVGAGGNGQYQQATAGTSTAAGPTVGEGNRSFCQ